MIRRKNGKWQFKWFRFSIPLVPRWFGHHRIYISYMGHGYGDERTGMYLQTSYNGRLFGPLYHAWRLWDLT